MQPDAAFLKLCYTLIALLSVLLYLIDCSVLAIVTGEAFTISSFDHFAWTLTCTTIGAIFAFALTIYANLAVRRDT